MFYVYITYIMYLLILLFIAIIMLNVSYDKVYIGILVIELLRTLNTSVVENSAMKKL